MLETSRRSFLVAKYILPATPFKTPAIVQLNAKDALEENRQNRPVQYLNDNRRRGSAIIE
jgi:hypothetical protein